MSLPSSYVVELDDAEGQGISERIVARMRETPEASQHVADVWAWGFAPPDRMRIVTAELVRTGYLIHRPNLWWFHLSGVGRFARLDGEASP